MQAGTGKTSSLLVQRTYAHSYQPTMDLALVTKYFFTVFFIETWHGLSVP